MEGTTLVSWGTFSSLAEPAQSADECGNPNLESRVRSRPPGINFAEGPVEISDDSDFEDSEEGLDLGLGEEHGALLDYLHAC